jgi:D-serine dehydratase
MGTRLGFQVTVHMSADARQWKKELLRSHGAEVVEHSGDYETAVREGRNLASNDPCCHFVDDEHSRDLFLGYSVAALRLRDQLREQAIKVDANHPLFVYLPCGVGGGPGGITFGLNQVFGKAVHCFFVEPTHSPAVLLGLATGLHEQVSVADFGLDNKTAADGLAVGRPSGFVGKILKNVIAGVMTVSDETLFYYLACLHDLEKIDMEPSALAGMVGMGRILTSTQYLRELKLIDKLEHTTHIVWGTGGSLVPETEMAAYYQRGQQYLQAKNQSTASSTTQ